MRNFRLCGLNCYLRSKVISSVMLFIGNIILRNVFFLDYFEEAVVRYSATEKTICLLGHVNINILRAETCNYAQQFLDCLQSYALDKTTRVYNNSAKLIEIILQISSANTLPVGTLFLTSLITFPNSASFNLPLKQLSLSKLLFETTQNTLSRNTYKIFKFLN